METFELNVEVRTDTGKGASRRLRRADKVPGILYGAGKDPISLTLGHNDLFHHAEHEAFYSHILTLHVDGKDEKAVLKDMQRHPYKPVIMHVDFLRVDMNEKIRMNVPLHFLNEDTAPGVKLEGGRISHAINEVEIICLPGALPEFIEVDLGELKIGDMVHMSDLKLPEGVEIVELMHGAEHDQPVASIQKARGGSDEDEEAESEEAVAEGEGEGEGE